MAATVIGISKAIEGPSSPDLTGENDWLFIDSSQSLLKVNEVGPGSSGSGPSTLHMVVELMLTCLVLLVLIPVIKMVVLFKNMMGCCKKNKKEYTVSHTPEKETAVSNIIFRPEMMVPRYSQPPVPPKNHWDKTDCGSLPETTSTDTNSRLSVASMEARYQALDKPQDTPKDLANTGPLVLFVKAGSLRETLTKVKMEAEERAGRDLK